MPDLLERLKSALGDRYAVESEIGRGGMAVVFLAEDLKHHRQVALKVLHPELSVTLAADRFLNEIEIVAGLEHPHILTLIDSGEADGLLYYIMPYVSGESLRQRLEQVGQLSVEEAIRIAVEVADGLDFAHRQGVIHRDVKPGNVLLSDRHAVITDFGIARAITMAQGERVTSTGLGVGTPLYASPEQATGAETLDGRTDIYALGCVLYEMLSGEVPLSAVTPQAVQARRMSEMPSPIHPMRDTVTPLLDQVIGKALARLPADRFETAEQFAGALMTATMDATPVARLDLAATPGALAITPTAGALEARRKIPRWLFPSVVTLVVALVAAWFLIQGWDNSYSQPRDQLQVSALTAAQLTRDGQVMQAIISPDGSHLAFAAEEGGGGIRVAVSEIGTAQPDRTLAIVDELWRKLHWLPDGSGVAFAGVYMGRRGGYSVSRSGGTVEAVGGAAAGVTTRDGSECLTFLQPWKYVKIDTLCGDRGDKPWPEGIDSISVAGSYEFMMDATYSPRGDYFLVTTTGGTGASIIRAVSRSGDDQRIVVDGGERVTSLHWRDGGRVLYYSRHLPSGSELMRLRTSTTGEPEGEPEPILQLGDSLAIGDISADSRRLILVKTLRESRIVRLRPDEAQVPVLESVPGTEDVLSFWVSPDGEWLAFIPEGTTGSDIYKVPIAGGQPTRITSSGNVGSFSWSPDGRFLAFSAPWQDAERVWIVSANGGSSMPLSKSKTSGVLSWTPGPLMYQMPGNRNYWVIDSLSIRSPGGSLPLTPANLDDFDGFVEGDGRPLVTNDSVGWMFNATSSPDGRWVAVSWNRQPWSGPLGLWMISLADSTQVSVMPNTRGTRYWPIGWTADGSGIYTQAGNDILLVPVDGSETDTVLTLPEEPNYGCDPLVEGSETSWVCWEVVSESDAWLIENFDPHVN
jgi:serine/threonine-protein kinase